MNNVFLVVVVVVPSVRVPYKIRLIIVSRITGVNNNIVSCFYLDVYLGIYRYHPGIVIETFKNLFTAIYDVCKLIKLFLQL